MTLNTRFYIIDPTDPIHFHDLATEQANPTGQEVRLYDDTSPGEHWNAGGQGLEAWVITRYAVDGPLGLYVDPEYPEDGPDYDFHHCVRVSFDTSYGFRNDKGEGCVDLHKRIIRRLADECADKGLRFAWEDEFTGDVHHGPEGLAALEGWK